MKKYLSVIFGVLFLLAFTLSAYAEVKIGGELRERGRYQKNKSLNDDLKTDDHAYYDTRIRLGIDAKVSDKIQGFIEVQYDGENENWGTYTQSDISKDQTVTVTGTTTTGTTTTTTTGTGTVKSYDVTGGDNAKATGLFGEGNKLQSRNFSGIRQAWVLYKFDIGVPAGIKVGHQLLALSHGQFFDHQKWGDDAIVFFMDPTKELHIGLLTAKFDEGGTALGDKGDDVDGYVALMTYKLDNANTIGANLTYVRASENASVRLLGTETPLAGSKFNFYNLGLHGTNKLGPVGLKWEGDIQSGKLGDSKFKGYGLMVDADYKVGPATIVLGGAYGSGPKEGSTNIDAFVTSLGADPHYTFVYEYFVPSAMSATKKDATNTGIANTTYLKAGVKYAATKALAINADGYYLTATKTPSGVDKSLGFEIDAGLSYKLADNLTYSVRAGYLAPGDYYKDTLGHDDAAYAIDHALVLSF